MSALSKLNEARIKFHSLDIKKTGHNKFAGYYYFELGDFLIPALTVFHELKLSGVVSFGVDLATMTITDLEDNTVHLITSPMSSAALKGCHDVQNLGAVQTYLRRYLWVAALEIVEHDAVDASDGPADKPKPRSEANKSVAQSDFDNLPAARQQCISDLAMEIMGEFKPGGEDKAYDLYCETRDGLPLIEEKTALKSRLPSNVRTKFEDIYKARKAAK